MSSVVLVRALRRRRAAARAAGSKSRHAHRDADSGRRRRHVDRVRAGGAVELEARRRARRRRAPATRRRSARRCRIAAPASRRRSRCGSWRPPSALRGASMVRIWSQPTPVWRSASARHSAASGAGWPPRRSSTTKSLPAPCILLKRSARLPAACGWFIRSRSMLRRASHRCPARPAAWDRPRRSASSWWRPTRAAWRPATSRPAAASCPRPAVARSARRSPWPGRTAAAARPARGRAGPCCRIRASGNEAIKQRRRAVCDPWARVCHFTAAVCTPRRAELVEHERVHLRQLAVAAEAAGLAAVAGVHVDAEQHRRSASVLRSRRRATYLAGSKYCTCESHRPVPTNIAG